MIAMADSTLSWLTAVGWATALSHKPLIEGDFALALTGMDPLLLMETDPFREQ
jgi:hypothetical protein